MSICSKASIAVMENWAVPLWLRIPLALSPLLPLVALALTSRTRVKSDELDLHIHREAVTFAFYGLFVILICVELLIRGRVLAGFVWTVETLITAMLLVLGLGYVWIWRRYR